MVCILWQLLETSYRDLEMLLALQRQDTLCTSWDITFAGAINSRCNIGHKAQEGALVFRLAKIHRSLKEENLSSEPLASWKTLGPSGDLHTLV